MTTRPWRVVAASSLVAGVLFLLLPTPAELRRPGGGLPLPVDASLRVPFSSALLQGNDTPLLPGDRVLAISDPAGGEVAPLDRADLWGVIESLDPGSVVSLRVERRARPTLLTMAPSHRSALATVADNWVLVAVGSAFLLFGAIVFAGSRHPVAAPVSALGLLAGTFLLSQLDLVVSGGSGPLGFLTTRERVASSTAALLPAALLHFSMRFPVVGASLRGPAIPAIAYAFWSLPALFVQLRHRDAAFLNAAELLAIGASATAVVLQVLISMYHWRGLDALERARCRALFLGVSTFLTIVVGLVVAGASRDTIAAGALLASLALPICIGWAIARYRLLDPPEWLAATLARGVTALAALASVGLALLLLDRELGAPRLPAPLLAFATGVSALAVLGGVRWLFYRGVEPGRRATIDMRRFVAELLRSLERARDAGAVSRVVEDLIARHFGAEEVVTVRLDAHSPPPGTSLSRSGLDLWARCERPPYGVVLESSRSDEPGRDVAEVVLPLHPAAGPHRLVVVSARTDRLPYTAEQLRMLEGVGQAATLALGGCATTGHLESVVAEKTESIRRGLEDRSRVLEAARAICEADSLDDVSRVIDGFVEGSLRGEGSQTPQARVRELSPHLETVRMFGELAGARLELVHQLKREVERQAEEIAAIRSRRLHAEFVGNVAHELRKPTEELRNLAERLDAGAGARSGASLRIFAAASELCRRLDLLLLHSGLRLDRHRIDLVRVIDDAVERCRSVHPDRRYAVAHALARVPVLADPTRILCVAENLLDNAAKATGSGATIEVRSWIEWRVEGGERRGFACFEVSDEGQGVPPELIDRVFEPGVSFRPGGFGLGLAVCRDIVARHDGTISIESRTARTRLTVRIPQVAADRRPEGERS